jgi:hypothetical protein
MLEEPSDAGGDDKSDCPTMEGFLKKLNSQGVWKDRYCQLQNAYFITYKPKDKKGPSNEVRSCTFSAEVISLLLIFHQG